MADMPLPRAFQRANPLPLPRAAIEQRIEVLIALLDIADGDPDLEDGDEDCCHAYEDRLWSMGALDDPTGGAGDPEDAEDEHDQEDPNEDEADAIHASLPRYGIDQTTDPLNYAALERERKAREMGLVPNGRGGWRYPNDTKA